jgi:hypothetical protein
MGGCMTKEALATTSKRKSSPQLYGIPSIEDFYQQNQAEMKMKKNNK